MAKKKDIVGPYGPLDTSGMPSTQAGLQKYIESQGGTYVSPASRFRAYYGSAPTPLTGFTGGMKSASYGGAPPTQDQLNAQSINTNRATPPSTYGSYTIDPTKGLIPIAGSQGTVMPGSDPMAQARAAGVMAQQTPPAPVVNSWTINPPGTRQYDPAAMYNQGPTGGLPPLNTGGVNPYLSDPLMAGFRGQQNPLYMNQNPQDFYGDPELFGGGY